MTLVGEGFRLNADQRRDLLNREPASSRLIHPYIIGRDLVQRREERYVIDAYGLREEQLRSDHPAVYDWLFVHVRPERILNNRDSYRNKWWIYAEPRSDLRRAREGLTRYIATCRTARHRIFFFESAATVPDAKVIFIGLDDAWFLGILSSGVHMLWANRIGAWLGAGNDSNYNHSDCFGKFPFPDASDEALKQRIRDSAEKLDGLRKQVLERHPDLTQTKLYNVLVAIRTAEANGGVLSGKERDIAERGCVSLIRQYHDEIDVAVAEAYGWPTRLSDEEILERLVALNKQRAAEEARGKVRWLRPEFQSPGYVAPEVQVSLALPEAEKPSADILDWPMKLPEQVVAVASVVERAGGPVAANDVAKSFKGKRAGTVMPVLDALAGMGRLRKLEDGRFAA